VPCTRSAQDQGPIPLSYPVINHFHRHPMQGSRLTPNWLPMEKILCIDAAILEDRYERSMKQAFELS
jgi:hypothetical protein